MSVTFTQMKNTIELSEKIKVDSGEKIVSSEKIGRSKKVDLTITTKGGKFYAYFDGEKYAGSYADEKQIQKLAKDYLKLVGESVVTEVRGKAGSSDGDEDADKNIIMQLRKVITLRGMKPVTFENGKTLKVNPKDADRILSVYTDLKPQSKMQLQTVLSKSPEMFKKALSQLDVNEYFDADLEEKRDPSKSGGSGYDLYHKDFSSAMKHAYDYAKKKYGIEIDPKEIDDKVASGPRKPSSGKTNSYRLTDKSGKKSVQIQVANLDNKKYELNMYKESVELDENKNLIKDYQDMKATGKKDHNILDALMSMPKYKRMSKDQMAKIIGDAKRKGIFKEDVELEESPMVTFTVPNVTSDMASKLERIAKEKKIEYSRKGSTVVLKGKRIDMTMLRTKMGLAQTNIPMVLVKEDVELEEAYKTPAEAKAYEDGKKAVAKKVSYDDNPNKKGTKEYTAWSKGHNDARAKLIAKRHTKENIGEAPEDDEPASPDELSMALKQLEFIEYAAEEIRVYLEKMGRFPEWMQNKLASVHDNVKSLHSQIDHKKLDERELTDKELADREKYAKDLPDADFKKRYGDRWMQVKMAVATDLAKKNN